MRLLHTSDWHLGRSFHGADLLPAQAAALDGLVEVVRSERVAAVLIAGDLYDRALPGVEAVELWGDTLERLTAAGASVIVIAGNHDSARRLAGGGARLLERSDVYLRGDVRRCADPVLIDDGATRVAVYPVPYLEPDAVRCALSADPAAPDPSLRTHAAVLRAALDRCRADLAGRRDVRGVAMAHAFVAGGRECDSERELSVGGAARVPGGTFAGFDYVALGHLHGRQVLGDGALRYSGSPLAYTFSEDGHDKGARLVDVTSGGLGAVTPVPAPVPRRLARVRGRLDDLLTSRVHDGLESYWLSVTVTDTACPAGAMSRVQRRFPYAVELSWQPDGAVDTDASSYAQRVRAADDITVVRAFVTHVRNAAPSPAEDAELVGAVDVALREPAPV